MKTYKNVELMISQKRAQFLIVAAQLERDRLAKLKVNKDLLEEIHHLIVYMRSQLDEAQTPNEVDKLINKIAKWD